MPAMFPLARHVLPARYSAKRIALVAFVVGVVALVGAMAQVIHALQQRPVASTPLMRCRCAGPSPTG